MMVNVQLLVGSRKVYLILEDPLFLTGKLVYMNKKMYKMYNITFNEAITKQTPPE